MTISSPDTERLQGEAIAIERELSKVIVGYPDVLRGVLITLLAGGHALLEGAPGLGKTLLVRTMADVLDLTYSRIQCTPDLMPSDILGTNVLMATGTYPLPEAQLDRFLFKLKVEFPSAQNLTEILVRTTTSWEPTVEHVTDGESLMATQRVARDLLIASHVMDYAARLVMATHPRLPNSPEAVRQYVRYGASPRAAEGLVLAAKMNAFLSGRLNVSFDDVRGVAPAALRHRIILNVEAEVAGTEPDAIVDTVLRHVPEETRG